MKNIRRAVAFVLALVILIAAPNRASAAGPSLAIVRWGDTLTAIAARYDTTSDALVRANALPNPNFIFAGQRLVVPASSPEPLPAATSAYTVRAGDTLFSIARRAGTSVDAILRANNLVDPDFIFVGQRLNLKSGAPIVNEPAPASSSPAPNPASAGKWIDVNLTTQTIAAYEGSRAVRSALVSTGVAKTPTPVGRFKIYVKYKSQTMSGGSKASNDYYYLPNVPNVMYFYEAYALHGTYWHRNFGRPMSRGCVNLSLADAEWFFNWAEIGTPVVTHD
ncbi:MAG: LysM peptidoglycan-binding domain-containing protein [Chloroflexi bacterium]|nr:LysM peptidoglycan-binding domain-containing protein [Chloroflexota bacterium]